MSTDRRSLLALAAIGGLAACARGEDPHQKQLREDFAWLGRYAADNAALKARGAATAIVFMGDSITEGWREKAPGFFTPGRVCRGISGQTTSQMVLRMMADVVALRPRFVHVMAGTNDVASETGPMTVAQIADNLTAMADIARSHGIAVLLASVPPAAVIPWRPGLEPAAEIRAINRWIAGYAAASGATWVDYTPALATAAGGMREGLSTDGVHPTPAGYAAMAGVLSPVLARLGV